MEAKRGHGLLQMWNDHEIDTTRKTSNSYEVTTESGQDEPSMLLQHKSYWRGPLVR